VPWHFNWSLTFCCELHSTKRRSVPSHNLS
jgi:hypothetical protein